MRTVLLALLVLCVVFGVATAPPSAQERSGPRAATVVVDNDGTVHVPAMDVPQSSFLSPEAKAYVTQHLKDKNVEPFWPAVEWGAAGIALVGLLLFLPAAAWVISLV